MARAFVALADRASLGKEKAARSNRAEAPCDRSVGG